MPTAKAPTRTDPRIRDHEAEMRLLGCLLIDSRRLFEVQGTLTDACFGDGFHAAVYRAICRAMDEGIDTQVDPKDPLGARPLDPLPVWRQLQRHGEAESQGIAYLAECVDAVCTGCEFRWYASRIVDCATREAVRRAARNAADHADSPMMTPEQVLEMVHAELYEAAEVGGHKGSRRTLKEIIQTDVFDQVERLVYGTDDDSGPIAMSGIQSLDDKLSGFRRGGLYVIAARPGGGKTSLAANIACSLSIRQLKDVAFISLEQKDAEIAQSIVSSALKLPVPQPVADEGVKQEFKNRFVESYGTVCTDRLVIWDMSRLTLGQVEVIARQHASSGLDVLIVDYIGLVKYIGKADSRVYQIEEITQGLKRLAKSLGIVVIALHQLGRAAEGADELKLSHLRDSGAVEQDADACILVQHFPREFKEVSHPSGFGRQQGTLAHFNVAKNRHGPTGTVEVVWVNCWRRFLDVEEFI